MLSEIFTKESKELVEDNKGELYIFKPKDHSDEQKESNTTRQRFAEPKEEPNTTGIPDLESEESIAEQKKIKKGKD